MTDLQKTVLSARLKDLVAHGIFKRASIEPGARRHEYRLTRKGAELQQVALLLLSWETRWDTGAAAAHRIELTHIDCGHTTVGIPACGTCCEALLASDIKWTDGPGEGWILANYTRRRRQADSVRAKQARTVFPDRINAIIGDRWSTLILRAIFAGNTRFDEIHRDTGAATNILASRLRQLIDEEVVSRIESGEYALAPRGEDTLPIIAALMAWGDKWYGAPEGKPKVLQHMTCGAELELTILCSHCLQQLTATNVSFRLQQQSKPEAA